MGPNWFEEKKEAEPDLSFTFASNGEDEMALIFGDHSNGMSMPDEEFSIIRMGPNDYARAKSIFLNLANTMAQDIKREGTS